MTRFRTSRAGLWASIAVALAAAGTARAQDAPDPNAGIAAETARINALTELEKARNARVAAALAPLTGLAGEGKVELKDNAGEMEAWLLTSGTIGAAGKVIADAAKPGATKFIVLAGDEALDFTPLFAARYALADTRANLSAALRRAPACAPRPGIAVAPSDVARLPALAAIGALGSVLQSDIAVQGVPVEASARLLATSVAAELGTKAVLPAALTLPDKSGSTLQDDLAQVEQSRTLVAERQACLAAAGKAHKAAASSLAGVLETHDKLVVALNTGKDGGEAPIISALKLDWLAKGGPQLLRIHVDKAGGTLLTRKNLWTALGAPAVGVTGGLVASFTAVNPTTGSVSAAGVVACRTRLASLRAVQRGAEIGSAPCRLVKP